jgi:nitrogen fixation NifU-like protein
MVNELYTKQVMKHFRNPKNAGEIRDADGIGKVGNIICGDILYVYIKVKDEKIKDIRFNSFGCVANIATSSVVTTLAKGKTISEALKLTKEDVLKELGSLPSHKIHCSLLAIDGLKEAVYDYFKKKGIKISDELEKEHQLITKRNLEAEHKHRGEHAH